MTDKELNAVESQLDSAVPYYVLPLIQAVRAERSRAESAERALEAATRQLKACRELENIPDFYMDIDTP